MSNIAVVGAGYWGQNLIRNLQGLKSLKSVCDPALTGEEIRDKYPALRVEMDYKSLLQDPTIEGVVIATPASTHYQLAKETLLAGKHVLVEKPFTTSLRGAEELVNIAEQKSLVLMVGFTFLYNAAVRKVKELIQSRKLGEIYYIYSQRLNLGKVRQDVNVWWNLAPHDVSIILWGLEKKPVEVNARGFCYIQKGIEDVVIASIKFEGGSCAFIHTSWLDPGKIRKMTIVGSKKMIVYDDVASDTKVQVYDKGIDKSPVKTGDFPHLEEYKDFAQFQFIQRAGDIQIPKIDFVEPLKTECKHFLECIESGREPLSSGRNSLAVVKVLEAAQKSLKNNGAVVKV